MPNFNKSKGFQLKSGNKGGMPFKEMGSSPAKIFGGGKKEEEAPNPALTRPSSKDSPSAGKWVDIAMSAIGSMGKGGDKKKEED